MIWISAALVFTLACLGGFLVQVSRRRRRASGARPREGERVVMAAEGLSSRVFVDQDLLGGPSAGGINRTHADLLLTPERLVVSTHHGRLLELTSGSGGSVRNTGPNRLVIEGTLGQVKIRVEALCDQAEQWSRAAEQAIHTSRSAA